MNKVLYKVNNLSKDYGQSTGITHALQNVSFEIYEGELLCIVGVSGSGKSTLLNLISGLEKPTNGEIYYRDTLINGLKDDKLTEFRRDEIGFVFQFFNLIDELNVYQNITLVPGSNKDKNHVLELLDKLGLKDKMYKYPRELSGGEQQRVSIARALNKKSTVLLCDEPTGALDYNTGKELLVLLEKLHEEEKKTIVIVTHTKEIVKMCDRVLMVRNGKIICDVENINKIKASEVEW